MPVDLRKATTVLPNLLTVGNMFLGFFAIAAAIDHRWIAAPVAIFIAHFLDILDGRLARFMRVSSPIGAQFDSFADWISFGLAPGIMIYVLALREFKDFGFLLTFLYVFAGAFRLARFNVNQIKGDHGGLNFSGLPIPGAGGFIAILVLLFGLWENGKIGRTLPFLYAQIPHLKQGIPLIVFSLSLLMVSKVPYTNFKRTHFFRPQSMHTFMMMIFVLFMIYLFPENTIFILYVSYILWGVVRTGWRAYRLRTKPPLEITTHE